jgi:hypothetical protein
MNIWAILIDPFDCTVLEVQFDGGDIEICCQLLSHRTMPVTTVSSMPMPDGFNGDIALFDEHVVVSRMYERSWYVLGFSHPLAGKALLAGKPDAEGNVTSHCSTIQTVLDEINFFRMGADTEWSWVPTSEPWTGPEKLQLH